MSRSSKTSGPLNITWWIALILASIVLVVVGILGLFPSIGWAHVELWRAILEIVVGGLVLIVGISRR